MRSLGSIIAISLLAACEGGGGGGGSGSAPVPGNRSEAAPAANSQAPLIPITSNESPTSRWDLQSSGEGVALALLAADGAAAIRLFCPAGGAELLVNVATFRPVASEERLSFGSGGAAHALVAGTKGDRRRGGVSGTSAVPDTLPALVADPISASYGAQTSGPHAAPPQAMARAFVAACSEAKAATAPKADVAPKGALASKPATATAGPCLMQGKERLQVTPLRAVGTEPFWGARIDGRCVTYSHPDDQAGTRVWTRYTPGPRGGGIWSGTLGGRRFVLTTRAWPGCSDGMSDEIYPIAVELAVQGERRTGCAEPLRT